MAEYNWIHSRNMMQPTLRRKTEPQADPEVSKLLGRKVAVNDPRLIRLVVEHKRDKDPESTDPLKMVKNPEFIKKLKEEFKNG